MNTPTHIHARRAMAVAAAAVATVIPSAASAGPQPIADDEYRTVVNHAGFRPCFIIQSHWNPAYDGFVPVCERPREQPAAEKADCQPPIDPRYVGVPWDPRVSTGCVSRDRWWIQRADR